MTETATLRVKDVKVRSVMTASPDERALDAARRLSDKQLGTLVVVDATGRPLGILTDRDLMERCVVQGRNARRVRVGDVMSGPVIWVRDDDPLDDALERMARLSVRRLPVIDGRQRLIGILALDDVLMAHHPADTPIGRVLRREG